MHYYDRIGKSIHHTPKGSNNVFSDSSSLLDEQWPHNIRCALQVLFGKVVLDALKSLGINLNCFRHCLVLFHRTFHIWVNSEVKSNPFLFSITSTMIAFKITDKRKSINELIQAFYNAYNVYLSEKRLL